MAAIPKESLVLITGATGSVGGGVAEQLLEAGLRVRAVVRNAEKGQYLTEALGGKYGSEAFHTVLVEDMGAAGALDEAMQGCAGVVHAASDVTFEADPHKVITPTVKLAEAVLRSAANVASITRVVFTSSISAMSMGAHEAEHWTPQLWNDKAADGIWEAPYDANTGGEIYAASKVLAERACWAFMQREKPAFTLTTVLPSLCIGPPVHPKLVSSFTRVLAGLIKGIPLFVSIAQTIIPNFHVAIEDVGRLHVAGLIMDDVGNERVLSVAAPLGYNDLIDALEHLGANKELPSKIDNPSPCLATVDNSRALELLKRQGQPGFVSLQDALKKTLAGIPEEG